MATNELGLTVGESVMGWNARPRPPRTPMVGTFCRLEPLGLHHADQLYQAYSADHENRLWTYLPWGPFASLEQFRNELEAKFLSDDPLFSTIIDLRTEQAVGLASLMRISPADGVIEVGGLTFSPAMQRTPISTEAMYLMMRRAFDELGYRRYEWKCDALNKPSRAAALRLGFQFEGIFRQATIYKGRNRDTAWYSILDSEWPALKSAFESWLSPDNFDASGHQRTSLANLRNV